MREVGPRQFSLRGTARVAGVDPALVYRHFADKRALVEAVAVAAFVQLASGAQAAVRRAGSDPGARLTALGRAYVQFAVDRPTEFAVMFRVGRQELPTGVPSAFDVLRGLLEELEAEGRLPIPVEAASLMCWSAVHGLATLLVDDGLQGYSDQTPDELYDTVVGNLLRFLGAAS